MKRGWEEASIYCMPVQQHLIQLAPHSMQMWSVCFKGFHRVSVLLVQIMLAREAKTCPELVFTALRMINKIYGTIPRWWQELGKQGAYWKFAAARVFHWHWHSRSCCGSHGWSTRRDWHAHHCGWSWHIHGHIHIRCEVAFWRPEILVD